MAALTSSEILAARADLEAELTDVVNVWRDTGQSTLDNDTLVQVPVFAAVAENVQALVLSRQQTFSNPNVQGDATQFTRQYLVTLPVDVDPDVGDYVEVITCNDSRTEGTVLTVRDVRGGSFSISRRLQCQENLTVPVFVPEA